MKFSISNFFKSLTWSSDYCRVFASNVSKNLFISFFFLIWITYFFVFYFNFFNNAKNRFCVFKVWKTFWWFVSLFITCLYNMFLFLSLFLLFEFASNILNLFLSENCYFSLIVQDVFEKLMIKRFHISKFLILFGVRTKSINSNVH